MVKASLGITHTASGLAADIGKYIEAWKSYSHFWKLDALSFVADLQVMLLASGNVCILHRSKRLLSRTSSKVTFGSES